MFKTAYNAMLQNIAPTETVCRQVLSVMQEEEARQMPTILPVKKAKDHRQVWTLVACAAMVLVAVALTATLMRDEKPPMLPAGVTTTVTETTATVTVTTTTTVENEIVPPPSTNTSAPTQSTTVAPTTTKTPSESDQSGTTTATTSTTTAAITTTPTSTLPPVGGYDELFPWLESFATFTELPSKNDPFPPVSPSASPITTTTSPLDEVVPSTTTSPLLSTPTPSNMYPEGPSATATPTTEPATLPTSAPSTAQPFGGVVSYEDKTTSNGSQRGEGVIGQLQGNTLLLTPLDSTEGGSLSVIKPPLGKDMVVKEFCLYGDRAIILCGLEYVKNGDTTRVFVYDISDPTAPRLLQYLRQDGYFLAAHRVDGVLYLASYYLPEHIRPNNPDSCIPHVYHQNTPSLLLPSQIVAASHPTCNGYTVLTAISLDGTPTITSAMALYGQRNSYVTVYDTSILIRSQPYTNQTGKKVSELLQVTLDKGTVSFTSRTILPE